MTADIPWRGARKANAFMNSRIIAQVFRFLDQGKRNDAHIARNNKNNEFMKVSNRIIAWVGIFFNVKFTTDYEESVSAKYK